MYGSGLPVVPLSIWSSGRLSAWPAAASSVGLSSRNGANGGRAGVTQGSQVKHTDLGAVMEQVQVTKITVRLDPDTEVEMTYDQARRLYESLRALFGHRGQQEAHRPVKYHWEPRYKWWVPQWGTSPSQSSDVPREVRLPYRIVL